VRIGHTVGTNQTVVAEVIIRAVIFIEVASVAVDIHSVFIFPMAGLVYEVPYKSTLIFRIFADDIPVFFESALRITHSMSVFALNQRFLNIAFGILDARIVAVVHRTENVCKFAGPRLFILYGT